MTRTVELLFDPDESPAIWYLGPAVIILALCVGIMMIISANGDSWAEMCVQKGGEYHYVNADPDANTQDEESCDMP